MLDALSLSAAQSRLRGMILFWSGATLRPDWVDGRGMTIRSGATLLVANIPHKEGTAEQHPDVLLPIVVLASRNPRVLVLSPSGVANVPVQNAFVNTAWWVTVSGATFWSRVD